MFKILLIKEIQSAIIDFRFWIVMLLCLFVIPLSFYVSVKNYSQRVSDYQQEIQTYREQTDGKLRYNSRTEGVRPPSPLSIFSRGLDKEIPNKVITSRDGQYEIEYIKPDNKKDLMGKIDFSYIVVFILSILAIVFTFSSISGDKESGVFRAVLSNPVLRRQILLAKLFGNYIVFSIPYLFSLTVALIIVYFSGMIPIFSAELFPYVLVMITISMLFLFAFFNLGLWISAFARSSILSINILILIWILIGLVIPKVSPIIAEAIYPVESTNILDTKKKMLYESLSKEKEKDEEKLYDEIRDQLRPGESGLSADWKDVFEEYDERITPISEKHDKYIASEINKLTADYESRRDRQNRIAKIISSLSIINTGSNLIAEFSGTGYSEIDNFNKQARLFQEKVKLEIYDNILWKVYRTRDHVYQTPVFAEGFKISEVATPLLDDYQRTGITQIIINNWSDIALLFFYNILFFVMAFITFLRFDVR